MLVLIAAGIACPSVVGYRQEVLGETNEPNLKNEYDLSGEYCRRKALERGSP